jgi:hypothetical protein
MQIMSKPVSKAAGLCMNLLKKVSGMLDNVDWDKDEKK